MVQEIKQTVTFNACSGAVSGNTLALKKSL